ncbi:hypothetical protein [Phytomonospora endophytica]|uniref:Uncharacterized protein n=1 Tax=Phytomonospora endophytica TaxID=714109 RepID=A0A841FHQ2_9ACTN|nr:hypothetical protein [Phytomonospora endophytica]MBB6034493.1 hypothetical protein [Phytomonospora endophytica]
MDAVLATLPADLRAAAADLYVKVAAIAWEAEETLSIAFQVLREARGEPELLDTGSELLDRAVAAELNAARDEIGAAGNRFSGSWVGGGAESFNAYLPKLMAAIESMEESAGKTAEAVRLFRQALTDLWQRIVERTWHTGGEVTAAVAQAGRNLAVAVPLVLGIVDRYAAYVSGIAAALLELAGNEYKAGEKLAEAGSLPGVADVGEPRLPLPADPSWNDADRKDNWRPGGELRMDTEAMATMIAAFRNNGAYWDNADRHQTEAAEAHLTPRAFGLGVGFYGDVQRVMARDRGLYRDADARMDSVAGALSEIGGLYGMIDEDTTSTFNKQMDDQ